METYILLVLLVLSAGAYDNEDPVVTCPSDITQPTDPGKNFATVNWLAPQVTDNVDSNLQATCDPASGGPVETGGPLTVTCEATDTAGNKGSCTFTIKVEDEERPVLNCPNSMEVATDPGKNFATYDVSVMANDDVDGALETVCMGQPAYGSDNQFDLGDTNITCTVVDANNNKGTCSFILTVSDQESPTLDCEDQPFSLLLKNDMAQVNYTVPMATDNVDGVSVPFCSPASGTNFETGHTLVNCSATDTANNTGNCTFNVILLDCDPGTFGPTCVNCTCVDNTKCVATSGDCPECDDIQLGFVCNYMELAVNITARGLSVLDDVVTQHKGKDVELECNYNLRNIDGYWSRNGEKVMDFTGDTGTATYTISSVDFVDTGIYTCTVNPLEYIDRVHPVNKSVTVNVEEKPDPVSIDKLTATHETITVTWTRGDERNSPIQRCAVQYMEISGRAFKIVVAENEVSHTIVNLKPYTDYYIDVFCTNAIGDSDKQTTTKQTAEAAPTEPRDVLAVLVDKDKFENDLCRVTWRAPEELNGVIRRYTAKYTVAQVGNGKSIKDDDGREILNGDGSVLDIPAERPYSVYTIRVFGTTIADGPESEAATCTTPAAGPSQIEKPVQPTNPDVNHDSFKISLAEPSSRNGPVICYTVIVVLLEAGDTVENVDPDSEYPDSKLMYYDQAKDQPYVPYVAVAFGEFTKEITIGSGEISECQSNTRKRRSVPCSHVGINGKLKSGSTYTVFLRAYVSEGVYSSSPLVDPVKTSASSVPGNVIAIVILCVVILIMFPPLIFFCRFYYSQKNKKMEHSTMINMTDYDDVELPETTRKNREYETTLPNIDSQDGSGDAARDAAAPLKVESHKDDSAYEEPHTYMSVEEAYTELQKKSIDVTP